jgi:hypothetical protein
VPSATITAPQPNAVWSGAKSATMVVARSAAYRWQLRRKIIVVLAFDQLNRYPGK